MIYSDSFDCYAQINIKNLLTDWWSTALMIKTEQNFKNRWCSINNQFGFFRKREVMQFLTDQCSEPRAMGWEYPRFPILWDVCHSTNFYSSSLPWYMPANMFQEPQMQQSLSLTQPILFLWIHTAFSLKLSNVSLLFSPLARL